MALIESVMDLVRREGGADRSAEEEVLVPHELQRGESSSAISIYSSPGSVASPHPIADAAATEAKGSPERLAGRDRGQGRTCMLPRAWSAGALRVSTDR